MDPPTEVDAIFSINFLHRAFDCFVLRTSVVFRHRTEQRYESSWQSIFFCVEQNLLRSDLVVFPDDARGMLVAASQYNRLALLFDRFRISVCLCIRICRYSPFDGTHLWSSSEVSTCTHHSFVRSAVSSSTRLGSHRWGAFEPMSSWSWHERGVRFYGWRTSCSVHRIGSPQNPRAGSFLHRQFRLDYSEFDIPGNGILQRSRCRFTSREIHDHRLCFTEIDFQLISLKSCV